ncbi:MAG: bacillithiol biosynthesis cysteine-adding enzyme BshC [Bacteroidia bacterium]|nr:bacillithiol biosynthesis cysteine-adding enzyme BshC [Bacteroidia bacterium]
MSFTAHSFLQSTKWFDKLLIDYFNQEPPVQPLYSYYPNKDGFEKIIADIASKQYDRQTLVEVLIEQAQSVHNSTQQTIHNIQLLNKNNAYTIITGHQLCLFTGPLFFIYKISSILTLSEQLKKLFPNFHFIPVFWMASEDHDFQEINHFYFKNKKYEWALHSNETPVGILNTQSIQPLLEEIKKDKVFSEEDIKIFYEAYTNHSSLSTATRYIINHLFGEKGIVIIDPYHKKLKTLFSDLILKDVFENNIFHLVQTTIKQLQENNYHIKAKPREINTFYIHENKRELIIKDSNQLKLKTSNKTLSYQELKSLLNQYPENFSPNVLLRPLYQQKILPNIAYIGGSAEVSYWLLLKSAFDSENILYPIILQRPIVFISPKNIEQKIKKLKVQYSDILNTNTHQIIYHILEQQKITIHFDNQKDKIKNIYSELSEQTQKIDSTLIPFVNAELAKALKSIDLIEQKLNRAVKQKNDIITRQVSDIYENFFPNNIMQDRIWNISHALNVLHLPSMKNFITEVIPYVSLNLTKQEPFIIITQNI